MKTFPIKWGLSESEGPDWEHAWDLVDLSPINDSEEASDQFFKKPTRPLGISMPVLLIGFGEPPAAVDRRSRAASSSNKRLKLAPLEPDTQQVARRLGS